MVSYPSLNDFHYELLSAQNIKFDADDSAPTYIGMNVNPDANDADNNWVVLKFTYSGSNVTQIVKRRGAWSDRASMF